MDVRRLGLLRQTSPGNARACAGSPPCWQRPWRPSSPWGPPRRGLDPDHDVGGRPLHGRRLQRHPRQRGTPQQPFCRPCVDRQVGDHRRRPRRPGSSTPPSPPWGRRGLSTGGREPLDVAFIVDLSGSMDNGRMEAATEVLDSTVRQLMEANPYNRAAVSTFSSGTYDANRSDPVLPLGHYDETRFIYRGSSGTGARRLTVTASGRPDVTVAVEGRWTGTTAWTAPRAPGSSPFAWVTSPATSSASPTSPSTRPATSTLPTAPSPPRPRI